MRCGTPLPGGRMYALASLSRPSGVPWAPLLLRGRGGTISTARGSDVRPGVPLALASLWHSLGSAAFAWQAWDSTARGSDVRPGVPLTSLWRSLGSAAFAWQVWDSLAVGCTPWRPSGVLGPRCFCTHTHSHSHSHTHTHTRQERICEKIRQELSPQTKSR